MTLSSTHYSSKSNPTPEICAEQAVQNACNYFGGVMAGGICRAPAPNKAPSNRSMVIFPNSKLSGNIGIHLHNNPDMRTSIALKDELADKNIISGFNPRSVHSKVSAIIPAQTKAQIDAHTSRIAAKELKRIERARMVWGDSKPPEGTVAELYLQRRGIQLTALPKSIRCHPDLPFWFKEKTLFRSTAMVALITNVHSGAPQGVHITFLNEKGDKHHLAPKGCARKMYGLSRDGCVRMDVRPDYAPTVRGVAEGIESALSFMVKKRVICDASLSAGQMKKYLPPVGVEGVLIAHDVDENGVGLRAGQALSEALQAQGIASTLNPPPKPHSDWNDFLTAP